MKQWSATDVFADNTGQFNVNEMALLKTRSINNANEV